MILMRLTREVLVREKLTLEPETLYASTSFLTEARKKYKEIEMV